DRRRLAVYVTASLPVALAGMALLAQGRNAMPPALAALIAFPLSMAATLLLVPVWYLCRALPVNETSASGLLLPHVAGALLTGLAAIYLGGALARLVGSLRPSAGLETSFAAQEAGVMVAGALVYLLAVSFHYVLLGVDATRRAEQHSMELSVLAREAELRALRAQVHPHFLFNSLNSISALVSADPVRAREMCVLLAEFFRKTLTLGEKSAVTVEEELTVARTYLAIEALRLGARLCVEEGVDEAARSCRLPPLLLQPLVENAIRHGIATCPEGGVLRIEARTDGQRLRISVENPFDPDAPPRPGAGVGLTNVRRRLLAGYGDRSRLDAERAADRFRVAISMPAEAIE
ncbi:MAG TPA: histidine kinase, partial [Vicinamibacteria bacterium]|nr:histidine kinase [Vicinamibacteria bacterium]